MRRRRFWRSGLPVLHKPFEEMTEVELADFSRELKAGHAANQRSWRRTMFSILGLTIFTLLMISLAIQGFLTRWLILAMLPTLAISAWNWTRSLPNYIRHRDGLDQTGKWLGSVPWPMMPGRLASGTATIVLGPDGKPTQMLLEADGDRMILDFEDDDGPTEDDE